jgi:hypothetical protein
MGDGIKKGKERCLYLRSSQFIYVSIIRVSIYDVVSQGLTDCIHSRNVHSLTATYFLWVRYETREALRA